MYRLGSRLWEKLAVHYALAYVTKDRFTHSIYVHMESHLGK